MFEIEKNVPVRREKENTRGRPRGSKYPFAEMAPGDSFFIPGMDRLALGVYNKLYAPPGHKFISRTFSSGLRIWLVKITQAPTTEIDKEVPVTEWKRGFSKKEKSE